MELRLLAMIFSTLLFFSASINAANRGVFSIPKENSIDIQGQDPTTINPNKNLPRLQAVRCDTRTYIGYIVTMVAANACSAVKRSKTRWPWKKYPFSYIPSRPETSFEIPGNPYYIFPIDFKGKTYGESDADFVVINEKCQLVGAFILNKEKKLSIKYVSRKRKRAQALRRTFVKKCILDIYDQWVYVEEGVGERKI